MEAKHTPGPWQHDDLVAVTAEREWPKDWTTVCSLSPDDGEPDGIVAYCHPDNAPIIAAAPKLLAALKAVLPYLTTSMQSVTGPLEEKAREAIAEAEGR